LDFGGAQSAFLHLGVCLIRCGYTILKSGLIFLVRFENRRKRENSIDGSPG
jgi:hypothetical protein